MDVHPIALMVRPFPVGTPHTILRNEMDSSRRNGVRA